MNPFTVHYHGIMEPDGNVLAFSRTTEGVGEYPVIEIGSLAIFPTFDQVEKLTDALRRKDREKTA